MCHRRNRLGLGFGSFGLQKSSGPAVAAATRRQATRSRQAGRQAVAASTRWCSRRRFVGSAAPKSIRAGESGSSGAIHKCFYS